MADAVDVRLRQATDADLAFLWRVQCEAMRPHVERVLGVWDEVSRRERFDQSTEPLTHEVVEVEGEPVGCQWIRRHPDALELVRLYLLPAAQGRGIGTYLMTHLCRQAAELGLAVRLRVLHGNPAMSLYRRLGFSVTRESKTHLYMERTV
jgi:ribosomal protein S18 acetylase RimI-like enzyme